MRPAEHADAGRGGEEAAALRRYWEGLDRGVDEVPDDLDPALAATVRRLRALHAGSAPAGARDRVWRRLREAAAPPEVDVPRVDMPATNGRLPHQDYGLPTARPTAAPRPRWSPAGAFTAVLLLVVFGLLGLGLRAFWPNTGDRSATAGATATPPPPTPTPWATAAPAGTDETLVRVGVPSEALPEGAAGSALVAGTVPPGARTTWTAPQNVRLFVVLSGAITVRAEGPLRLQRAGLVGSWEDFAAGAAVDLGPGDAVLLLRPASVAVDNPGPAPAEVLGWSLAAGASAEDPPPSAWAVGDQGASGAGGVALPGPRVMLWLRRVDLAPSARLAVPPESFVHLAVAPDANAAGTPQAASFARGEDGSLRNAGPATVVVYVVTMAP